MTEDQKRDAGVANSEALPAATLTAKATPFSPSPGTTRPLTLLDGRYILQRRIGGGAFGDVYQGMDTKRQMEVAVKLERRRTTYPQLSYESKVYSVLHRGPVRPVGIPRVYQYNTDGEYNILVMDLCGPSLEDIFDYCGRRLSLKSVCMLVEQMLQRLEFLHNKGFIHRDIKPENFVFGVRKKGHILYLIDYGLSKQYWDRHKQMHIPFAAQKSVTGTARYCSTWTHLGYEQGRRDDMEAVGFIVVYLLKGSLPWQGIAIRDLHAKTTEIGLRKNAISVEELCAGLPEEVLQYCEYCRKLKFAEKPDYEFLREFFRRLARQHKFLHTPTPSILSNADTYGNQVGSNFGTNEKKNGVGSHNANSPYIAYVPSVTEYDWMFDWFLKRAEELRLGGRRLLSLPTTSSNVMLNGGVPVVGAKVMHLVTHDGD